MVGEAGIEPAWDFSQRILSPSCMPIPPLAREIRDVIHGGRCTSTPVSKRNGGGTRTRTGSTRLCRPLPYQFGYAAQAPIVHKPSATLTDLAAPTRLFQASQSRRSPTHGLPQRTQELLSQQQSMSTREDIYRQHC